MAKLPVLYFWGIYTLIASLTVLAAAAAAAQDAIKPCIHRDYGFGNTVCVCNATYCDSIAPLKKTEKGVITSYVTSYVGDRFAKSEFHFTDHAFPTNHNRNDPLVTVTIDPLKKYQKILGIGGAFTDASGFNIASMPKEIQGRIIRDYFAEDGLEYNMARVPMAGCDESMRPYTYHEVVDDDNLTKFELAEEDLRYKIPFMQLANQVSPHKVRYFASPWSAPTWIKTNHQVNHGGFILGAPGGRYYKIFAKYFVKFLDEYVKHQVPMWGITVCNEPQTGYDKARSYNSLGFNSTLQRDFVKLDLGPALHSAGYTTDKLKVMIYDDNVRTPVFNFEDFVTTVLEDKEAAKYISGMGIHWYVTTERTELDLVHQKFPDQFILSTESCELRPPQLGKWTIFEDYASSIIRDFNHFSAGWIEWNLALDPRGKPTWVWPDGPNGLNAPIIVNTTSHEYYKQPIFYALGHFSKFILPDSIRLHHSAQTSNNGEAHQLRFTTFERPDGGKVLVLLNTSKRNVEVRLHDPDRGNVTVDVKPLSLQTLLWY